MSGALRGSLSFLRFLVDGSGARATPPVSDERAVEARRFMPLSPTGESSESAGWVPLEAPYDDELAITRDLFVFGELIAIAYREDRYAIPKALLQRETKKRVAKIVKEEKRDPADLGSAFIKAVEQSVLVELKARTIPRSKIVDVIWDTAAGEVRVHAMGTIATERVVSLFERTFQVRLELASYAARAFTIALTNQQGAVLERLSPGWLFPDSIKTAPVEEASDAG